MMDLSAAAPKGGAKAVKEKNGDPLFYRNTTGKWLPNFSSTRIQA
jgi:hypothetical protein